VRALAHAVGLSVARPATEARDGGYRGLGDLLAALHGHLDESWRRYLRNLLALPMGENVRNDVAHGLLDRGDERHAAALIHVACFLRLLEACLAEPN
jgi:hypothetical protein